MLTHARVGLFLIVLIVGSSWAQETKLPLSEVYAGLAKKFWSNDNYLTPLSFDQVKGEWDGVYVCDLDNKSKMSCYDGKEGPNLHLNIYEYEDEFYLNETIRGRDVVDGPSQIKFFNKSFSVVVNTGFWGTYWNCRRYKDPYVALKMNDRQVMICGGKETESSAYKYFWYFVRSNQP